ncbi:hypothetical protein ND894_19190 [Priestia megaterium]|uniref:hypothetical protein n=1 Tax=Priestia megaterium TaxID=1404 RepID=UPI002076B3CB|nr:hypothetical protein [Priestia megaterium]USD14097.1 hypothetical protein ND894_19190 [Priestia megaterium]
MKKVVEVSEMNFKNILFAMKEGEDNYDFIEIKSKCDYYYLWKKESLLSYYDCYIKECSWALDELKELQDKEKITQCQEMLDEFIHLKNNHQKSPYNYVISYSHDCKTGVLFGAITKEEVLTLVETEVGFDKIIEISPQYDNSHMDNFAEGYFF